jgi:tetrahydromethanopterin S-methyltransferase subunit E
LNLHILLIKQFYTEGIIVMMSSINVEILTSLNWKTKTYLREHFSDYEDGETLCAVEFEVISDTLA